MKIVESIHIYPVKGMPGLQVQSASLAPEGFEYDRRWMLVDENYVFISQRTLPELVSAKVKLNDGELSVEIDQTEIVVHYNKYSEQLLEVSVFDDKMKAHEVDPEISNTLSNVLNKKVRLVQVTEATNRVKDFSKYLSSEINEFKALPRSTAVSFADGYPYLIAGTASMDLLNEKLNIPLNIDRFRANIIIKTTSPHEEDDWKKIIVGDQELLGIKPCARCQVITIDQQNGMKGKEPLLTLSKYRTVNNKVLFGQNAISLTNGTIRVGDQVKIN